MRKVLPALFIVIALALLSIHSFGQSEGRVIFTISLSNDIINPVSAEYITKAIKEAEEKDAECLIIELDTPGGLLTSTREIVKEIMGSKVPIVVYVAPSGSRAGSAGVFITLSANIAAMAPSTNIGAAHPVSLKDRRSLSDALEDLIKRLGKEKGEKKEKKKEEPKEPMEVKVLSDTTAWVEGIAKERGRNVEWAIKAVTESVSVSDEEALRKNVIDLIAKDIPALVAAIDGMTVRLTDGEKVLHTRGLQTLAIPKSLRLKILSALAIPNIAYILLMLGFYGLLFEFTHPGIGFPGVAGLISIIVAFYGLHLLAANYAGIALIVLGIILFIMEVRIVSYGLLTLGGFICLFLGSLMLFDSPYEFMRVSLPLVLAFTVATLAIAIFLVTMVVRSHRRKVATGREGMEGVQAEVQKWSGNKGRVFAHGEIWSAEGEGDFKKGDMVEVVDVRGMKLIVKKI